MKFDDYSAMFNQYKAAHPLTYQSTGYQGIAGEVGGGGGSQDAGSMANDELDRKLAEEWIQTLSPEQQADYAQATQEKDAKNHKEMPLWGLAALATVATMGALNPAVMGGTGGIFGGGAAAGGSGLAEGSMADLYLGAGGAPLTSAEYAGLGGLGAATGAGSALSPSMIKPVTDALKGVGGGSGGSGGGGGTDWGSILGGAGLGAAALAAINGLNNKQELPALPDYMKLAEQTSADKTRATNEQTLANRPNQTNAMGDTSQWVKDPVTGQWTQKVAFGAPQQAKFDETNSMLAALRGGIGSQIGKPLDMSAFQTPGAKDPYAGVDLGKLQPAGYTPMGKLFGG